MLIPIQSAFLKRKVMVYISDIEILIDIDVTDGLSYWKILIAMSDLNVKSTI